MKLSDRVKALSLPLDQVVVIGSGLLDQLGLRKANDIDLAVSPDAFEKLIASGEYEVWTRGTDRYCQRDDLEIWTGWHEDQPYEILHDEAITIDGVLFVNPKTLIAKKRERGSQKDLNDIALLEEYYAEK